MAAWFEPIRTIMIVRAGFYDGTLEPPKRNVDVIIDDGRIAELRAADGRATFRSGLRHARAWSTRTSISRVSGEPDMMGDDSATTPNQRLLHAVENARKVGAGAGVTTIRDVGSSNAIAHRRPRRDRARAHSGAAHARRRRGALHDRRPRLADRTRRRLAVGRAQSGARADVGGRRLHQADRDRRRADQRRGARATRSSRTTSWPPRSTKRTGTACASPRTRSARTASRTRCAPASTRSSTAHARRRSDRALQRARRRISCRR